MARRIQLVNNHGRTEIRLDCGRTFGSVFDLCMHQAMKVIDERVIRRLVDRTPFEPIQPIDFLAMLVLARDPSAVEDHRVDGSIRIVDGPQVVEAIDWLVNYSPMADELCENITTPICGRYMRLFTLWYGGQLKARGVPLE